MKCDDCGREIPWTEGIVALTAPDGTRKHVCLENCGVSRAPKPIPGLKLRESLVIHAMRSGTYTLTDADARVVASLGRWAGFDGDSESQAYTRPPRPLSSADRAPRKEARP